MDDQEAHLKRVRELVLAARDRPRSEHAEWLAGLGLPPGLVEEVLRAIDLEQSGTLELETLATQQLATAEAPGRSVPPPGALEPDPETIGPYEVRKRLGEGGFGVVYLAHQEEPIRRDVAIKVVRAGMGGQSVLVRFEAERQALAMMSHPALATVIDAGSTAGGDPFFVMEYVDGRPIDEVCDAVELDLEGRIRLFIEICEAIQHAHGKGIIHRDLKPGNILVARDGARLLPRVIDFGIAKAVDPDTIGTGSVTVEGQFIGTPHYMAPEQTGFTGQDVDVRADVFSLGSVLYELLVGRTPVDRDTIARAREQGGLAALKEVLCDRPSVRASVAWTRLVRDDPERAGEIARARGVDPRGLSRALAGDLDWILLKALELDRDRRYETPLGLADDLRRCLAHEPVKAGPPSRAYRLSKFVRRNRAAVLAVGAVFLVLVIAIIYSNSARLDAERRLQETESTLAFVDSSIGDAIDPSYGGGRDLLAVDYFANAYGSIERDASLSPRVQVRLYEMYARVLLALNDYELGAECARAGLAVIERNRLDSEVAVSANELRYQLAQALRNQGLQTDAVALEREIETDTPEFHASRAFTLHNAGDYDAARWHYLREIALREPDGESFPLSESIGFLGRLELDRGRVEAGTELIERSAAMAGRLSETDGSSVAGGLLALGAAAAADLRFGEALDHYERAHRLYLDLHGTDEVFMVELCRLEILGLLEDAAIVGDGLRTEVPPPGGGINTSFLEAIILRNRARNLHRAGAVDAAYDLLERSLAIEGVDGDYHRHTGMVRARLLLADRRSEGALETVDALLEQLPAGAVPGGVPGEAAIRALRCRALIELGRAEEARAELRRLRTLRGGFPPKSPPLETLNALEADLQARFPS